MIIAEEQTVHVYNVFLDADISLSDALTGPCSHHSSKLLVYPDKTSDI